MAVTGDDKYLTNQMNKLPQQAKLAVVLYHAAVDDDQRMTSSHYHDKDDKLHDLLQVADKLPIQIKPQPFTDKLGQKTLIRLSQQHGYCLVYVKKQLFLVANGMKVSLNWLKLQRRVVNSGKKTELLIKATKLNANSVVIDATAGFGHDSLVMAGVGARVHLCEANPVMYLLLVFELEQIKQHKNWQKLASRLDIHFGQAQQIIQQITQTQLVDSIYLDPMFPTDISKTADVGKAMQVLHQLAKPPMPIQEVDLLTTAQRYARRVIVKRPRHAPYLANSPPDEQWLGDAVRFDGYLTQ